MMKRATILLVFTIVSLTGCTSDTAGQILTVTALADRVYQQQTLDALTPSVTPTTPLTPSSTATLIPSPTVTPTSTFTPTPVPDIQVLDAISAAYLGPQIIYPILYYIHPDSHTHAIGRDTACGWVQVQVGGGDPGWVANDPMQVKMNVSCESLPLGTDRPGSGTVMVDNRRRADQFGFLWVNNTSGSDAVVIVANSQGAPVLGFYLRSSARARLEYIPFGTYRIYVTIGEGWLAGENRFRDKAQHLRMQGAYTFTSSQYWDIILYSPEGNTGFDTLNPGDFPQIGQ